MTENNSYYATKSNGKSYSRPSNSHGTGQYALRKRGGNKRSNLQAQPEDPHEDDPEEEEGEGLVRAQRYQVIKPQVQYHGENLPSALTSTPPQSSDSENETPPRSANRFNSPETPPPVISNPTSPQPTLAIKQANPVQANTIQANTIQAHPAQVHPAQVYPAQVYPAQVYPAQAHPAQGHSVQGRSQSAKQLLVSKSKQFTKQFERLKPTLKKTSTSCYDLFTVFLGFALIIPLFFFALGKALFKPDPKQSTKQRSQPAQVLSSRTRPAPPVMTENAPKPQEVLPTNLWPQSPPHIPIVNGHTESAYPPQYYPQVITKIEYTSIISSNVAIIIIAILMAFIMLNSKAPPLDLHIVDERIKTFLPLPEGTGRIDFASAANHGTIEMALTSDTYQHQVDFSFTALLLFFANPSHPPQTVISGGAITPGNCWAINGTHGFLTIKLHEPIVPNAVTYEHVHKSILIDHKSMPRKFTVYGLNSVSNDKTELGSFEYNSSGDSTVQTFSFNSVKAYKYIMFEIMENYGHPSFTSVYRFRVHGELSKQVDMLH